MLGIACAGGAMLIVGSSVAMLRLLDVAALEHAEPAAVGVVVGCVPVVLALTGPLLARRAPVARVVAAAFVVAVGAAVVQGVGDTTLAGFLLSLGALAGEALFSLLALSLLPRLGPVVLSTYVCAIAASGLALAALLVDGDGALPLPTAEEAAATAYLALAMTAIAVVAWYTGVERLGVERATSSRASSPSARCSVQQLSGPARSASSRPWECWSVARAYRSGCPRRPSRPTSRPTRPEPRRAAARAGAYAVG
jgi:drug/metabolite transporter (DMT)-like permease